MSARTARTWITLHETTIRPLPDRTPLRKVLQALREATRGKDGKGPEVDFRFKERVLEEAESITLDTPVLSPFVGQPRSPSDTYLKYVLRQFLWERRPRRLRPHRRPVRRLRGIRDRERRRGACLAVAPPGRPRKVPEKRRWARSSRRSPRLRRAAGWAAAAWRSRRNGRPGTTERSGASRSHRRDRRADRDLLDRILRPLDLGFRVLSDGNILIVAAARTRREAGESTKRGYQGR